jgi:peptidyl-prolyl cis-trans isomerase D
MISWMQKHKKWLVITIWISTIAFVGAGFVGWGSYSYGKNGGTVATIGSLDIDANDLQKEYSGLYAQYEQMFGKEFNQEMADKMKLDEQAYNNLVQKYLVLNLAKKYGIEATDTEVVAELMKYEGFVKDGKFDKEQYIKILNQNKTNPTDFENSMKKDIVFFKTISILNQSMNQKEMETLNKVFFSEDNVSINIISANSISKSYTIEDLKKYWEANKNNYKTKVKYKLNTTRMKIGEDEKQAKNEALKKYLSLKNKKEEFASEELVDEQTTSFENNLPTILSMKAGDVAKPIKINDEFVIVKMLEKIEPKALTFEEAAPIVKNDFDKSIIQKGLDEKKNLLLKNFQGTNIGYFSKEKPPVIPALNSEEIKQLANEVFASKSIVNSVSFPDKIVVFKIENTKIGSFDSVKNQFLLQSIEKIKNDEVIMSVLEKLQKEYEINSNMKVK